MKISILLTIYMTMICRIRELGNRNLAKLFLWSFAVLCLGDLQVALASDAAVSSPATADILSSERIIRILLSLIAVVALAYAALGAISKTSLGQKLRGYPIGEESSRLTDKSLRVVERLSLDRDTELFLVEVQGEGRLLLSKCQGKLETLMRLSSATSLGDHLKEHPELRVVTNHEPKS